MFNLIKNEYIKMFKKKSTLVLGIVLLVACIAWQGILKYNAESEINWNEEYAYSLEEYEEDLKENEDYYDYRTYNSEKVYVETLKKLGVSSMNDWRCGMVSMMLEQCYVDGEYDKTAINEYVSRTQGKSFGECLDILAEFTEDSKYDNPDIKNPVTNSYKYLKDLGVEDSDDWRVSKVDTIMALQNSLESGEYEKGSKDYAETVEQLETLKYVVENDYKYYVTSDFATEYLYSEITNENKFWGNLLNTTGVLTVLSIIMLIVAGQIVAGEFAGGTIKFLLINPVKRGKIITSKYAAILSFSAVMTILCYIVNVLLSVIFNGGDALLAPYISYSDGNISTCPALLYLALLYAVKFLMVIVYETMAFALSSLFKSTAAAVGVGIACLAFGETLTMFLVQLNLDWGRYLIFANSDLNAVRAGTVGFPHMTIGFSVAVIVVHMIVFLLAAYDGFVRREV